jgi:hypothetical protein
MVEPDHRSAEQQAGERPHRQVGLGTARALLWVLIPVQLGMVRVAERCRGCFGCIESVCAMREWARVALTSMPEFRCSRLKPSLLDSTLAARFGPLRALKWVCRSWYSRMVSRTGNPAHSLVAGVAAGQRRFQTFPLSPRNWRFDPQETFVLRQRMVGPARKRSFAPDRRPCLRQDHVSSSSSAFASFRSAVSKPSVNQP